jgi:site-specific recombinase XerD
MLLCTAIEDYLLYALHEQHVAKTTHKQYRAMLRHFDHWMTENGYPDPALSDVSTPLCRRFLQYLSGKGLRPRTTRSYFHALRALGAYAIQVGLSTEDPIRAVSMPRKDAAGRLTISDDEIRLLLEAVERDRNPKRLAQRRAVLYVGIYGALRRAEMTDLRVDDIDVSRRSVLVRSGKGAKSRVVFLPDAAIAALREWITLRGKCLHPYLFSTDRRRRMHFNGIAALLEEIKMVAGLADHDNIKWHSIRHWRATDLLRAGADLKTISTVLGHSSLQTTSIYLHSDEQQARIAADLSCLNQQTQEEPKPQPAAERPTLRVVGTRGEERERPRSRRIARG